jgi:hypothetical protein
MGLSLFDEGVRAFSALGSIAIRDFGATGLQVKIALIGGCDRERERDREREPL